MLTRLATALLVLLALPASAETPGEVVRAELLEGWRGPDGRHMAALKLQLAPGWKTYWRAPGATGFPPSVLLGGSENLAGAAVHWPAPRVFGDGPAAIIGYEHAVVLPLELSARQAGEPIHLRGEIRLGVCREVCIPVTLELDRRLAAAGGGADPAIAEALARAPADAAEAGVRAARCSVEGGPRGPQLVATVTMPPLGPDEIAVLEPGLDGGPGGPVPTRREGGTLVARADLPATGAVALDRGRMRLTVLAGGRAVEIRGCRG